MIIPLSIIAFILGVLILGMLYNPLGFTYTCKDGERAIIRWLGMWTVTEEPVDKKFGFKYPFQTVTKIPTGDIPFDISGVNVQTSDNIQLDVDISTAYQISDAKKHVRIKSRFSALFKQRLNSALVTSAAEQNIDRRRDQSPLVKALQEDILRTLQDDLDEWGITIKPKNISFEGLVLPPDLVQAKLARKAMEERAIGQDAIKTAVKGFMKETAEEVPDGFDPDYWMYSATHLYGGNPTEGLFPPGQSKIKREALKGAARKAGRNEVPQEPPQIIKHEFEGLEDFGSESELVQPQKSPRKKYKEGYTYTEHGREIYFKNGEKHDVYTKGKRRFVDIDGKTFKLPKK